MKQTAVEYIKEKLMCNEYWYENMTFDQIFEQAKEMEKEQIIRAHLMARCYDNPNSHNEAEQYYNEIYESNT
jgi:hypothetical protein